MIPSGPGQIYYYGTLGFARDQSGDRLRFDGVGVAAVDPRSGSLAALPNFNEWFIKINIILIRHNGVVMLFQTFCDWDQQTASVGTQLRTVQAESVFVSTDHLNVRLAGAEWHVGLRKSTIRGF